MIHKHSPEECQTLDELRVQIDAIDEEIISLLTTRFGYTCSAHRFKTNEYEIRDPARVEQVLEKVKYKAQKNGFDEQVTKQVYEILIQYCIEEQLKIFNNIQTK
jgi:isochorismate pyruvate lyase